MDDRLLFIMTGGTIDAVRYETTPKNIVPLKKSGIPAAVEPLPGGSECDFDQWLMKDSKDFSDAEMSALAKRIRCKKHRCVVITHGTDRMPENSRKVLTALGDTDKTVVFTGSMKPLSHGPESDGYTNLRFVLAHIRELPPGVHVVMHEQVFSPVGLWKDFQNERFHASPP